MNGIERNSKQEMGENHIINRYMNQRIQRNVVHKRARRAVEEYSVGSAAVGYILGTIAEQKGTGKKKDRLNYLDAHDMANGTGTPRIPSWQPGIIKHG